MYTQNSLPTDSTVGPFPIGFDYLSGSTITVTRVDTDGISNPLALDFTFEGTVSQAQPSGSTIRLAEAIVSGKIILIQKNIDLDSPVIIWSSGAEVSQDNLRKTTTNLMEMAQSVYDFASRAATPVVNLLTYVAQASVSAFDANVSAVSAAASAVVSAANAVGNVTGNLNLNSVGARLSLNTSAAILEDRAMVQNSTANAGTNLQLVPNGTSRTSSFTAYTSASPSVDGEFARLTINTTEASLIIDKILAGTGVYKPLAIAVGGAERMRVDIDGRVGLGLVPTARDTTGVQIGSGIGFPAVQVPSTDVNTLDDYEEGVWTPAFGLAVAGTSAFTYSAQQGRYTKIGRLVTLEFRLTLSAFTVGTGSGQVAITGLPFASGFSGASVNIPYVTGTTTLRPSLGLISGNTAQLYAANGVLTPMLLPANLSGSVDIIGTAQYTV